MKQRKIRILFDAQALTGNKSGVGYYTANLIEALAAALPEHVELIGHYYNFLGRTNPQLPVAATISYKTSKLLHRKLVYLLRRLGLELPFELLIKKRGDFILFPNFLGHPSIFRTPSATVLADAAYLDHPEYVSAKNQKDLQRFMPITLRRSSFAITISAVTKAAIKKYYPWYQKDIFVGHIPPTPLVTVPSTSWDEILRNMGINGAFLLFMGTIEPRKNLVNLLLAYALLPKSLQSQYTLVLAGGTGWNDTTIKAALHKQRTHGLSIIQTGYVSDEQKSVLYSKASLLVFPSWYEGYGMPLLEASSIGLPIVASDIAVFHEILGSEAAVYCTPGEPDSIATALCQVLSDAKLRQKMLSSQQMLVKTLDWHTLGNMIAADILSLVEQDAAMPL